MKEHLELDFSKGEDMANIARALSVRVRLQILDIIKSKPLNISEIAEKAGIPISSTAMHIKTLEEAGIVITQSMPGLRGFQRVCGLKAGKVTFVLQNQQEGAVNENVMVESMPIGNYFDCDVTPPCGIVSDTGFLSSEDSVYGFYSPDKHTAQLLWFTQGFLEYRFSNYHLKKVNSVKSIEFSFELCSEAPGYNYAWKSNISMEINGISTGHFISDGDYGGRRGKLNPSWWDDNMTQFGLLKHLLITRKGTYMDESPLSPLSIKDYHLTEHNFISFKIGVKKDAHYLGGLNLFGEKFGDYAQNIQMKIVY